MNWIKEHRVIVVAISVVLILLCLVIAVASYLLLKDDEKENNNNDAEESVEESDDAEEEEVAECDETVGQSYVDESFNVNFNVPCSFGTISKSEGNASNCPGETGATEIIFFSGSGINLDVNQCPTTPYESQIDETYTLTSKDGKKFTVYIYHDAFDEKRKFLSATSDYKLQLRAAGGPDYLSITEADLPQMKIEFKQVIESLEFNVE